MAQTKTATKTSTKKSSRLKWYHQPKKKQNNEWNMTEKSIILTCRQNNMSTDEIILELQRYARKMRKDIKLTRTIIHNQVRMMRRTARGRCYRCGHRVTKKAQEKRKQPLCLSCRKAENEYKEERRNEALKKGLCGYCMKRPVVPGTTACKLHLSSTYRRRIAEGICGICGKRKISKKSKSQCDSCLELDRLNGLLYSK